MRKRLLYPLWIGLLIAGCQAVVDDMAVDVAETVRDDLSEQIGTEVAVQVGTAVAEEMMSETAPLDASERSADLSYDCVETTCGQMTSCEEAVYKLYVCDHTRRDSDNDGVPCESMCRSADVPAIATSFAGISPTAFPTSAPGADEIALVTRVIDGDTIDVLLNGETARIRYLQMNTPERDEPCFRESTQANVDLVQGQTVRLVADAELVDPFDRLLRYVYVGEVLVNRVLVEKGFAEVVLYPPNDAHYDEFRALEQAAAAAGIGCHPTGIFDDGTWSR